VKVHDFYLLPLRDGVAFDGHLEFVGGLNGSFRLRIDRSLDLGVFGGMDRGKEIKVVPTSFLLPERCRYY
jgi:hypothetical protein